MKGAFTYQEIIDQPAAWAEALSVAHSGAAAVQDLWRHAAAQRMLFIGCGSTYYLSLAAAALARGQSLDAGALPSSEVWLSPHQALLQPSQMLLVAVSRSGETSETVHAVDVFRRAGGKSVLVVTCYPGSALARRGDLVLAVPAAQEQSVAQTRSFASMLIVCRALIACLAGDQGATDRLSRLPAYGRRIITAYGNLAASLGADMSLQRFFFLGSGPRYGLACEAMLKMKEMSLSYSEAYHVLEFRHGPKSMVDDKSLVIGLMGEQALDQEAAVLGEMRSMGGRTLSVADAATTLPLADSTVAVQSGLPEADRLLLYLPPLQLLAYHRAMAKGLDPDGPRNLTAVVTL